MYNIMAKKPGSEIWETLASYRSERVAHQAIAAIAKIRPEWQFRLEETLYSEVRFFVVRYAREGEATKSIVVPARNYIHAEATVRGLSPDPITVWLDRDCPITGFLSAADATALAQRSQP